MEDEAAHPVRAGSSSARLESTNELGRHRGTAERLSDLQGATKASLTADTRAAHK